MGRRRFGRRTSALVLYLLAPFVGEGLLGNVPITGAVALVFLAPLYGGGAVLIREITCRLGAGWPTRFAFAAAYALIEAALVDQMVFTPRYLKLGSFAGYAPIPGLGTSATLLAASLTMHVLWSICVPIAVAEATARDPRTPWLGRVGLGAVAVLFVLAGLLYGSDQAQSMHFTAGPLQYGLATAVVIGLVLLGLELGRARGRCRGRAPSLRTAGLAAFGMTSGYWLAWVTSSGRESTQWLFVAGWCGYVAAGGWLLVRWSRAGDWTPRHALAVALGALATYGWVFPVQDLSLGAPLPVVGIGWLAYGAVAVLLAATATRRSTVGDGAVSAQQPGAIDGD